MKEFKRVLSVGLEIGTFIVGLVIGAVLCLAQLIGFLGFAAIVLISVVALAGLGFVFFPIRDVLEDHIVLKSLLMTILVVGIAAVFILGGFRYVSEQGYDINMIISGSMEPVLMTNGIVVSDRNVPYEDIKVGDIISYTEEDHERVIQHRVYKITEIEGMGKVIQTKGDNNRLVDPWTVKEDQYQGQVILHLNGVKGFSDWFYAGDATVTPTYILVLHSVVLLAGVWVVILLVMLLKEGVLQEKIKAAWNKKQ